MKLKPIVVICTLAMLPIFAQAQQSGQKPSNVPKPTLADVQKVVAMIRADKAKMQTFCDLAKLDEQIEQAEQAKDSKKADELDKQAEIAAQKLGQDYKNLMMGLETLDQSSKEAQAITAPLEALGNSCQK